MRQQTDKFLTGIVVGIVLLVVAAFAVVLLRPMPTYRSEETPEGVVHNYVLALRRDEYERAHGYLAPTIAGYPASVDRFIDQIEDNRWSFERDDASVAIEVISADVRADRATVDVRKTTFYQGDIFDNGQYSNTFIFQLQRDASTGAWQIIDADDYWVFCWSAEKGCNQ